MEGSHRAVTNSISTQLLRATTFPRTDGNLPGPGSIQFANVWPWTVQKAQIPRRAARGKSIWVHNVAQGCTHCTDDAPGVAVKAQVSASPLWPGWKVWMPLCWKLQCVACQLFQLANRKDLAPVRLWDQRWRYLEFFNWRYFSATLAGSPCPLVYLKSFSECWTGSICHATKIMTYFYL